MWGKGEPELGALTGVGARSLAGHHPDRAPRRAQHTWPLTFAERPLGGCSLVGVGLLLSVYAPARVPAAGGLNSVTKETLRTT